MRVGQYGVLVVFAALLVLACSSSSSTPDKDAGAVDAGACGTQTCSASQYCVRPCCGGAGPLCDPLPEGGTCPPGTTQANCNFGGPGCQQGPCTPPPPYCSATIPSGCSLQQDGQVVCTCA